MKNQIIIFLILFSCWSSLLGNTNPEVILLSVIKENPYNEISYSTPQEKGKFKFYYLSSQKTFVLRTILNASLLTENLFCTDVSKKPYLAFKKDNSVFYENGFSLHKKLVFSNTPFTLQIVPYQWKNHINKAFISDQGEFTISFPDNSMKQISEQSLEKILNCIFKEHTITLERNSFRNYYTHPKVFVPFDFTFLYPLHKITLHKHILDNHEKGMKDRDFSINMLSPAKYLLSQNERVKNRMVPSQVKLRWKDMDNLDIGSGQNMYIFCGIGPGINYFDDPFRNPRKNLPSPRLILRKDTLHFKNIQFYPDYSIGTYEKGMGRFHEFNFFQTHLSRPDHPDVIELTPKFISIENRKKYIRLLEKNLLSYGLLNNDPNMEKGFSFNQKKYQGNIINNEMRIMDFLSFQKHSAGLIIPEGYGKIYLEEYLHKIQSENYPEWINQIHYQDYFIEGFSSGDSGMRQAYFYFILKDIQPLWAKILLKVSKSSTKQNLSAIFNLMEKILQKYPEKIIHGKSAEMIRKLRNKLDFLYTQSQKYPENKYFWLEYRNLYNTYRLYYNP